MPVKETYAFENNLIVIDFDLAMVPAANANIFMLVKLVLYRNMGHKTMTSK